MVYYDGQVIANQIVYGAIGTFVIQKIKSSKLVPFINEQTYWINRTLAILTSGIAAIGINYSYSYTSDGVLNIAITGLTFWGLVEGMKQWLFAYVIQQTGYKLTKSAGE